ELGSRSDRLLELPWHFAGIGEGGRGAWTAGELVDEFVSRVERFAADAPGPVLLEVVAGPKRLKAFLHFDGELLRAAGPGRPRTGERATFYVVRATGRGTRFITVLEPLGEEAIVQGVRAHGGVIEVDTVRGTHRHTATPGGWEVAAGSRRVRLAGGREPEPPFAPLLELDLPKPAIAAALRAPEDCHSGGGEGERARGGGGGTGDAGVGCVAVPEPEGRALRVRASGDTPPGRRTVRGAWQRIDLGFRVTLGVAWPEWQRAHV